MPLNVIQGFAESSAVNVVFGEWVEYGYFKVDGSKLNTVNVVI